MTTSFKNDLGTLEAAIEILDETIPMIKDVDGPVFPRTFNPILPSAVEHGKRQGGNSLGLENLDCALVIAAICATWNDKKDDQTMVDAAKRTLDRIDEVSKSRGVYHP